MLKRVSLYISSNFTKMLSTLIMFTVMLSLIGALLYVYTTVGNRIGDTEVFRSNYIVNQELMFSEQQSDNSKSTVSYVDLYEKAKSLDGLEAYKIDSGMSNAYLVAKDQIDFSTVYSNLLEFAIADDEKQMDFYSGNAKLLSGDFSENGILVSQEFAKNNNVSIGTTLPLSSIENLENDFVLTGTAEAKYSAKLELEISGIFEIVNANEAGFVKPENIIYMPQKVYEEANKTFSAAKVDKGEGQTVNLSQYDFQRFLAQYDNEESLNELNKYASENYPDYEQIDSTKAIEKSLKPLNKFNTLLLILSIVAAITAVVGMFLNMYLKIDKRRSEFIALLSFGVNSFKLSIQVFLEQLVFLIISIPFAYLFVKYIVKFSIEIIKKYFIVLIDTQVSSSENISGFMYSFVNADSRDVVDFQPANIWLIIGGSFMFLAIALFALSVIEMMRRYKNVKKV